MSIIKSNNLPARYQPTCRMRLFKKTKNKEDWLTFVLGRDGMTMASVVRRGTPLPVVSFVADVPGPILAAVRLD